MKRVNFLRLLLLAPLGGARVVAAASGGLDPSVAYLLRCQSEDGAWRSDVYGAFRDGCALTPVVLRCLSRFEGPEVEAAVEKGVRWLVAKKDGLFARFPVHVASAVLECSTRVEVPGTLKGMALGRLRELQGGPDAAWSYSPLPLPSGTGAPLPPMQQPNLSATAIAIDGLRAAGDQKEVIRAAMPFVKRCQNLGSRDRQFDDGGFFQMPLDPVRNKAGQAGRDREGRMRFRSYGAATADGLRGLLAAGYCGRTEEVSAARKWLNGFEWSGSVPRDLAYYTARSVALVSEEVEVGKVLACRRADGSWMNPAGEMRENCPLVATSLALEACVVNG